MALGACLKSIGQSPLSQHIYSANERGSILILFILAGNDNIHESWDEFEIWLDPTRV